MTTWAVATRVRRSCVVGKIKGDQVTNQT